MVRSICATRSGQARLWLRPSRKAEANSCPAIVSKPITETTHGFNRVTDLAEFFAQAAHVCIHCSSIDHAFVAPNFVEQAIAFLNPAPALHQRLQQFELQARETHLLAV